MENKANNNSKTICKAITEKFGWTKESRRNVVTIDNEKWSFSVSSNALMLECRQTYEDTVGFITQLPNGKLMRMRVGSYADYPVSRISPKNVKAYNVVVRNLGDMEEYAS